jgi:hypothetical protein
LSLFHTKAKTRKESIWGPFAHNKWVAFSNEEYTPNTNCVFLFTRTLRHHSCSVYFPFVANHTRSSADLPWFLPSLCPRTAKIPRFSKSQLLTQSRWSNLRLHNGDGFPVCSGYDGPSLSLSLSTIFLDFSSSSQSHVSSGLRFCSVFVIRKNPHPRRN